MADKKDEKEKNGIGSESTKKSTVRNRKSGEKANTQRYVPIAEIHNDTVILKNGGLRAVLQVEPLNFNLKSETEQEGIIAGYESFINTLVFPLQILVRSSKINIEPYLEHIHDKASGQKNQLLKEQTIAYATFIEKIVELADIMQKRFYVIIPLDDTPKKSSALNRFLAWMNVDDTISKALQRNKRFLAQLSRLKERIDLVDTGLRNIGLVPRRLKTLELIQLYYEVYNREQGQSQQLPKHGNFNTKENVL